MEFKYVAQSASGEAVRGVLEADSSERAEELLWRSNLTIISLKRKIKMPSLHEALPSLFGIKRKDIINFSRDLATMLNAGLPMLRSLDILYRQSSKGAVKTVIKGIIQELEQGSTFSEACEKQKGIFPTLFVRLIKVGEEVGNLASVLEQLSVHMAKEEETAGKIKGSLAYPIFVLCLAFGAAAIMIVFVMPAITALFSEFGSELPTMAQIAINIANFLNQYILHILLGLVVFIVAVALYFRTPNGRKVRDTIILKLPVVGEASLKNALARTGRNMAMMVRSGVPLTEALNLCVETAGNEVVRDRLRRCNDDILSGQSLSQAMSSYPLFPVLMTQMVGIGEETGRLESNLETLSGFYEVEAERAITKLTGMLGPAMIVIVGALVGFVAMTLFSSIYSVADLIG
jgi:type IV pilus assembly protein PilC